MMKRRTGCVVVPMCGERRHLSQRAPGSQRAQDSPRDSLTNLISPTGRHPQNGSNPQMGSTLGRVGGRIAGAAFSLDGATYKLTANAGNDSLHSGPNGLDTRRFEVAGSGQDERGGAWVMLTYTSPDGDMVRMGVAALCGLTGWRCRGHPAAGRMHVLLRSLPGQRQQHRLYAASRRPTARRRASREPCK